MPWLDPSMQDFQEHVEAACIAPARSASFIVPAGLHTRSPSYSSLRLPFVTHACSGDIPALTCTLSLASAIPCACRMVLVQWWCSGDGGSGCPRGWHPPHRSTAASVAAPGEGATTLHAHMHTCTHMHAQKHACSHAHQSLLQVRAQTLGMRMCTHACTHVDDAYAHEHARFHPHQRTHTLTHTGVQTHTHACKHAHMHAHTLTHCHRLLQTHTRNTH